MIDNLYIVHRVKIDVVINFIDMIRVWFINSIYASDGIYLLLSQYVGVVDWGCSYSYILSYNFALIVNMEIS